MEKHFVIALGYKAFRNGLMEIFVDMNNVLERQNKDFKYEHLKQFKVNTLSDMFTVLTEQFLPDKYKR